MAEYRDMGFTYRHGDRPLEGYTILRGIGRGGFGEVYYAVSDGGREVALKSIQQNHEIELRGVRQCMNLKCPQLVTIFDVHEGASRPGSSGPPFIVMEYIEGPSLRDLLDQSPDGVSDDKAAFLVREIARGLSYLHERGIVHRDLKPENLFYEDGYVKIGDYGLSKFISTSRQSGQTISVGTVHYMAPEIGSGNYQRGIDIYALGVILFELLTGRVPFDGSTLGEILMKHVSVEPDVSDLSPAFRPVVRKALQKKPEDRYPDAASLAADILNDRALGERISRLGPGDFSEYTARHLREATSPAAADTLSPTLSGDTAPVAPAGEERPPAGASSPAVPDSSSEAAARARDANTPRRSRWKRRMNELASGERGRSNLLSCMTMLVVSTVLQFLVPLSELPVAGTLFYFGSIFAITVVVLFVESWSPGLQRETRILRRVAITVGGGALLVPEYVVLDRVGMPAAASYACLPALLAGLFCIDWQKRVRRDRPERLLLGPAFGALAGGILLALVFDAESPLAVAGILAGTSLALNAEAPFATGRSSRERRDVDGRRHVEGAARTDEREATCQRATTEPGPTETNTTGVVPGSASGAWRDIVELKERMRAAARSSPSVQLIRPRREAILGGVCAGLARYMDVGALAVRLTFVLFALLTWGWAVLAYIVFWLKIPAAEGFELTRGSAAVSPSARSDNVRAALTSPFSSYLFVVLGFGAGLTLVIAAVTRTTDVLRLGFDASVAGMAGCFLLTVAAYRILEMRHSDGTSRWVALFGCLVYVALLGVGLAAVETLVVRSLPDTSNRLTGWSLAIVWAVAILAARLAVEAPGLLVSGRSFAPRGSDLGQPARAAAWGLLGTTFVLASVLIAFAGVATTTGLAEAVFLAAKVERYGTFMEFGQHREHFLIGLVLFLPGLFCHLAARRWGGGLHVLRGAVGLAGGGLVFGLAALLAPEYVQVSPEFDVSLSGALSVEAAFGVYLTMILSGGCLRWPGRSVQWRTPAPLASAGQAPVIRSPATGAAN